MISTLLLLVLHFVADFLLQSRAMGQKKSSEPKYLAAHLAIQVAMIFAGLLLVTSPLTALKVSGLNAIVHGIIDWNIWRLYKASVLFRMKRGEFPAIISEFKYWEDHLFYATIGLDQMLHTATLVVLASKFL